MVVYFRSFEITIMRHNIIMVKLSSTFLNLRTKLKMLSNINQHILSVIEMFKCLEIVQKYS